MTNDDVRFEVDVSSVDRTYGLTLFVIGEDQEDDGDTCPCYFLIFEGPEGVDPESVAKTFSECHKNAIDSVGLAGDFTQASFETLLEDSIEMAGNMMSDHGFRALEADEVDKDLVRALFFVEETNPKLLN